VTVDWHCLYCRYHNLDTLRPRPERYAASPRYYAMCMVLSFFSVFFVAVCVNRPHSCW
jgi:hypothetical protein